MRLCPSEHYRDVQRNLTCGMDFTSGGGWADFGAGDICGFLYHAISGASWREYLSLESYDTHDLRQKILDMEYADWVGMGMNRSTLYYLKKRIREGKPLNLNRHVRDRMEEWGD